MLKFVRLEWRLTQDELAAKMEPLVDSRRGDRRKNAIRTAISQMETEVRTFRSELRAAAAKALDIPEDWFLYPKSSMAALKRDLKRLRQQRNAPKKIALPEILKTLPKPQRPASLPAPNKLFREPEREDQIKEAMRLLRAPGSVLIAVEALSGYGKSSFVSLLLADCIAVSSHAQLVVAVSCRGRSTEQILKSIEDSIHQIDSRLKPYDMESVFQDIPSVLVLDDLYHPESRLTPATAGELASRLAVVFEKGMGLKLIVTGGIGFTAREPLLDELKGMIGPTRSMAISLGQLSQADVAWYLHRQSGLDPIEARSVARTLGGDPLRLASFVSLRKVSGKGLPALQLVRRLEEDDNGGTDDPNRSRELQGLVAHFCNLGPTTYLTGVVLALSPNGLTIEACARLVRGLVNNDSVTLPMAAAEQQTSDVRVALARSLRPFVTQTEQRIELHARLRKAIAGSAIDILGEEGTRLVHRRMAEAALARLPVSFTKSYIPSNNNLDDFLALLQHLMDLYALAPDAIVTQEWREVSAPKSERSFDSEAIMNLLDDPRGIRSRYTIANVVFDTLMLSRVGKDSDERILTRQFGDFEQKLDMLSRFLVDRDFTNPNMLEPIPELRPEFASHVLLDVAVCANQAGMIDVAHGAIRRRSRYRSAESTGEMFDRALGALKSDSELEKIDFSPLVWSLESDSEHLNIYVSVLLREGEFQTARTFVDRYAQKSGEVLEQFEARRAEFVAMSAKNRRRINSILVSCRRLSAKRGQVLTLEGELALALPEFERAMQADEFRRLSPHDGPVFLSGETGRSYCLALAAKSGKESLAKAMACVDQNIDKAAASLRTYDLLDWYTLQAAIFRLQGNSTQASASLAEAEQIRREDGVAVSYLSLMTLSIEAERQKLRRPSGSFSTGKLKTMYEVADASSHKLVACDAALLLAEASEGKERVRNIGAARAIIGAGYGFRARDVELLELNQGTSDLI